MKDKTKQSELWRSSKWGTDYISRNENSSLVSSNIALFSQILKRTNNVKSICEVGANIGLNLDALNTLNVDFQIDCIEINEEACNRLKLKPFVRKVLNESIIDYISESKFEYDFVFTKGVLIHINPEHLQKVYEKIYLMTKKYVCFAEYYNPSPVSITYRGIENALFKRDFANEFLMKYKDAKLIDYGFVYRYDSLFPQDDITWFLIEIER